VRPGLAYNGRNPQQSCTLRRAPSALAGDDLKKAIVQGAHNDGLDNAVLANRIREFVQGVLIKVFSRLMRIWQDSIDIDFP
jgi:hypothetical protein